MDVKSYVIIVESIALVVACIFLLSIKLDCKMYDNLIHEHIVEESRLKQKVRMLEADLNTATDKIKHLTIALKIVRGKERKYAESKR